MLPDEHGDVHAPPPSTAPVVVRPIQPHQSRTIRLGWRMTIWTAIVAAAPDILSAIVYLVTTDPAVYEWTAKWLPASIRYPAMAAIITYAQRSIALRKVTVAPIAGTDSAKEALPAINLRAYVAPAPTDVGGTK